MTARLPGIANRVLKIPYRPYQNSEPLNKCKCTIFCIAGWRRYVHFLYLCEKYARMKKNILTIMMAAMLLGAIPLQVSAAPNIEIIDNDFQQINITVSTGGVLHVSGANGMVLQVYNVLGVRVASIRVEGNDKRIDLPLKSGCYIVKVGDVVRKISVNR